MKKILFIIVAGMVLTSCYPCKRLARKCPPQIIHETKDSIVIHDSIIYKDKEVPVYIPGDTVYSERPIPTTEKLNVPPMILENKYALARAWIENSKLKMQLEQKDQIIKFRIDSAIQIAKHWEYRWNNEKQTIVTPPEKYIPKIYKIAFFAVICEIILLGIYIYIKIRTGAWKSLINKFKGGV